MQRPLLCLFAILIPAGLFADANLWSDNIEFGQFGDRHHSFSATLVGSVYQDTESRWWVKDSATIRLQHSGDEDGRLKLTLAGTGFDTGTHGGDDRSWTLALAEGHYGTSIYFKADDQADWGMEKDKDGDRTGHSIDSDQTKPTPTITPKIFKAGSTTDMAHFSGGWFTENVNASFTLSVADAGSGAASMEYKITGPGGNGWTGFGMDTGDNNAIERHLNFTRGDGDYVLYLRSTDHVGNHSDEISYAFSVDTTQPDFSGTISATLTGGSADLGHQYIKVTWPTASDPLVNSAHSDFAGYDLYVGISNTPFKSFSPGTTVSETDINIPSMQYNRSQDNYVRLRVVARDRAGNSTTINYAPGDSTFLLPKQVAIKAGYSAVLTSQAALTSPTDVSLPLNIKPADFSHYSQVTIKRVGSASMATSLIQSVTITSVSDSHLKTYVNEDGDTYLRYVERIDPLLGTGGTSDGRGQARAITYTVATQTVMNQALEKGGNSQSFPLPYHPGRMKIEILDMSGNVATVNPDGQLVPSVKPLKVDESGRVFVRFSGEGVDADDWVVGVHQIIPQVSNGVTYYIDQQLGGAENANILYKYDPATYKADTRLSLSRVVPITLSFGDNNIQMQWKQKADPRTDQLSSFLRMKYEMDIYGRFTLGITTADSPTVRREDSGAILVSPGQPLDFHLKGKPNDDLSVVKWDFGDGVDLADPALAKEVGADVSHTYHQKPSLVGDSSSYTIVISNLPEGTKTAYLPLVVQNTRDGALYENEVWNGPHMITGNVVVPAGKRLTIGSKNNVDTKVQIASGLARNLDQGITVLGELVIGNADRRTSIVAQPPGEDGLTGLWGTVLVKGTATINRLELSGADRGITATAPSSVTLTGVEFVSNRTGLHVLTNRSQVSGSLFSGNTAYGVKEDGAHPLVRNTRFEFNGANYYRDEVGTITIAELNTLSGGTPSAQNSGNQE